MGTVEIQFQIEVKKGRFKKRALCLYLYINNFVQYPGLSLFNPYTVGRIV